jgi:hypothetical protein
MLDLFERIHDTEKYILIIFVSFISFYFTSDKFNDYLALLILILLITMMLVSIKSMYYTIYKIGSYISVFIEKENSGFSFHRNNRKRNLILKKIKNDSSKKVLYNSIKIINKWGNDTKTTGSILIILSVISGITVILKKFISSKSYYQVFIQNELIFIMITLCSVFSIITIISFYYFNKIPKYSKSYEILWMYYKQNENSNNLF